MILSGAGRTTSRRSNGCFRVLRVFGPATFLALAGCAATGRPPIPDYPETVSLEREYRVERLVKKTAGAYTVYPSGFVRIEGGDVVRLYRERPDDLLILTPIDPDAPVRLAEPAPALDEIEPPTRNAVQLQTLDTGLPRTGQWRERFTLAQIDQRPGADIVTSPLRKSGRPPRTFGFDAASGWTPVPLQFPARGYDYGSAVQGDFDADGRDDIALAMHLQGFAAFMTRPDGLVEHSEGLPSKSTPPLGTGRVLLTRPDDDGDRLLLLREPMFSGPGIGLLEMAWRDGGWRETGFSVPGIAGDRMALSAPTRCGEWLAVAAAGRAAPRLWQHAKDAWTEQPLPAFPSQQSRVADVAFGDFDGDGCDDLAVAYSPYGGGAWYGSVDVFLARRNGPWQRQPVWQKRHVARPVALGFLARVDATAGEHLVVLDDAGGMRLYSFQTNEAVLDLDLSVPEWRSGCDGVAIAAGDIDGDNVPELIAAFAGEPSSFQPMRCRNGGGFEAWKPQMFDHQLHGNSPR